MSNPVHRLVTYRPKAGAADKLLAILKQHGPALRKVGLISELPVRLWRATDVRRDGAPTPTYFVESFEWRDADAAARAHEVPEVMAVWETMGPHLEDMTLTTLEPIT